jgi:hypothetical protein
VEKWENPFLRCESEIDKSFNCSIGVFSASVISTRQGMVTQGLSSHLSPRKLDDVRVSLTVRGLESMSRVEGYFVVRACNYLLFSALFA